MTPRHLMIGLLAPALLMLAACDDDGVPIRLPGTLGGGNGAATVTMFNGVWGGAYLENQPGIPGQWDSTFTALIHDGRMMLLESNGQTWDTTFELTNPSAMRGDEVVVYGPNGIQSTRVTINATLTGSDLLDMNYNLGTGVGLIQMQYNPNAAWQRPSSLAQIAGIWSSATPSQTFTINNVNGQAVFDGVNNATSCMYNGVIELIDPTRNLYEVSELVITDGVDGACDVITTVNVPDNDAPGGTRQDQVINPFAGGGYTGYATLLPDQDSLLIAATNGNSRAVRFTLRRD